MLAKQRKYKNALKVEIPLKQRVDIYYTQSISTQVHSFIAYCLTDCSAIECCHYIYSED